MAQLKDLIVTGPTRLNGDVDVNGVINGSIDKAIHDQKGNVIDTRYSTTDDTKTALAEAKAYTDTVKNSLLNGAGEAYDTLKELGDLIDENTTAIDALNKVAAGKADASHTHNLKHHSLYVELANTTTDTGWNMIESSYTNNGAILKSIRTQGNAPAWICGNYASGIAFGGSDTKGVLSVAYSSPQIKLAGGNGTKPTWYITLTGTSGTSYNLNKMPAATTADSATKATQDGNGKVIASTYLPLTGGTLSGNLKVGSKMTLDATNGYVTGSWLQTTSANHQTSSCSKIATIDSAGWVYYRTPAEVKTDIGATTVTLITYEEDD